MCCSFRCEHLCVVVSTLTFDVRGTKLESRSWRIFFFFLSFSFIENMNSYSILEFF